jgi:hypothetical protein
MSNVEVKNLSLSPSILKSIFLLSFIIQRFVRLPPSAVRNSAVLLFCGSLLTRFCGAFLTG